MQQQSLTLISLPTLRRWLDGWNITTDFLFDFYQRVHHSLPFLSFFFLVGRYVTYFFFPPKNIFSTSSCQYSLVLCPSISGSSWKKKGGVGWGGDRFGLCMELTRSRGKKEKEKWSELIKKISVKSHFWCKFHIFPLPPPRPQWPPTWEMAKETHE